MPFKLNPIDLRPNDLKALCSPGVYLFWQKRIYDGNQRGEVALYIGSSRRTIARMADPKHESAQKALRECTRIEIRFCGTEDAARELEASLIVLYKPLYNKAVRKYTSITSNTRGVHR